MLLLKVTMTVMMTMMIMTDLSTCIPKYTTVPVFSDCWVVQPQLVAS